MKVEMQFRNGTEDNYILFLNNKVVEIDVDKNYTG